MHHMFKDIIQMYVLEEAIEKKICESKEMLILSSTDSNLWWFYDDDSALREFDEQPIGRWETSLCPWEDETGQSKPCSS